MDVRSLRTLLAVIDHASFSRAADALGYTQSAVSQQVAALESELGVRLVTRRPVAPTTAGAQMVPHAREILLRADAATAAARRAVEVVPQALRLAVTGAADGRLPVAAAVGATRVGALAAPVLVHVAPAREVVEMLGSGACDLAVVDGVAAPGDPLPVVPASATTGTVLRTAPLAVLVPATHPLAAREAIDLAVVADARWVQAPHLACPATAVGLAARCELHVGLTYTGHQHPHLGRLVADGHGLAFMPADDPTPPGTATLHLRAPGLTHRIEAWHANTPDPRMPELIARLRGDQ